MKKIIYAIILLLAISVFSCKPEDPPQDSNLVEFIGVSFEKDTTHYLDTTRVVAHAIGTNLTYQWQTSSNAPLIPIEGIDSVVLFYSDPCLNPGIKYVYCTIIAENREEMKMDSIILVDY